MDNRKTILFEQIPVPNAVVKLAVPTVLSSLVMVLYNLADTYFVGMPNNPIQNAVVTPAAPALLMFNAANGLFGVGSSSMISRALGRKEYETVRQSSAFGFYCTLFSGILLSLMCTVSRQSLLGTLGADVNAIEATEGYLIWTVTFDAVPAILSAVLAYMVRSEGVSLHVSIGTVGGCLLNITVDPVFIMSQGSSIGAAGAGLVTFLSNCVACIYFFVLLYRKRGNTYISIRSRELGFRKLIVLGVCGVGIPASIQNLLNATGMTISDSFASIYGVDAVAAMGIIQKINMVPLQIAVGFSQGIMPPTSYTYASGNHKWMKEATFFTMKALLPFLICVSLVYYTFAGGSMKSFISNPTIVAYGTRSLRGFCLSLPFMCMGFIAVGTFQAIGMGRSALVFAILKKIILEIPALYILNYLFPLYGLTYAQLTAELVLSIAAIVVLRRIFVKLQKTEYL